MHPVATGSHFDTQPHGERFDGVYWVLACLEVVRNINELCIETERPITVVNRTKEEGVRYPQAMPGSSAYAGQISLKERCWIPEYSGLRRRVCPTFPADSFFGDSGTIRDKDSSPSRRFQVATLPGVSRESAMAILVELGPDMSVFASARHCAAWTGICPGNNESAGKRRSGRIRRGNPILRAILVECAQAAVRTRGCQFQTWHQAVKSRRGYKRAIVAVAHKMLRTIYAMLRDGTPYADPGIDYEGISISRKASHWLQKLEQYGYITRLAREDQPDMSARPA